MALENVLPGLVCEGSHERLPFAKIHNVVARWAIAMGMTPSVTLPAPDCLLLPQECLEMFVTCDDRIVFPEVL